MKLNIVKDSETLKVSAQGVVLRVHLDYQRGIVSFVNDQGKPEDFKFAERTVDYLGGWVKIFNAMKEITVFADKLLREQAELRDEAKTEKFINLFTAIKEKDL